MREKTMNVADVRKNLMRLFDDGTDRVIVINRGRIHAYIASARFKDVQTLLHRYGRDPDALRTIAEDLSRATKDKQEGGESVR